MDRRRLTPEEVDSLRRSLAMAPQLPAEEVRRLLDDHRLALLEREELVALLGELEPSFTMVRSVLNRLHRLLADGEHNW